jgi:MOSC domain-containing protein YiiM
VVNGGFVEAIHIATVAQGAMVSLPEATAEAGKGIQGDRYAVGGGTFSDWPHDHEFTLVEAEVIEAAAAEDGLTLAPGETRRNITTRGIALNNLVGKQFRVGDALCEGTRLCEPCAHLESLTGKGGLCRILAGRGGLRAIIRETGSVRVGDAIVVCG